ncbi:MAG: hypothetical protein MUE82_00895 [Chloroflexi bacterium]|jgi:hypothetical protein|nr:hypothetical protein [Chloroflexota bacterium]
MTFTSRGLVAVPGEIGGVGGVGPAAQPASMTAVTATVAAAAERMEATLRPARGDAACRVDAEAGGGADRRVGVGLV